MDVDRFAERRILIHFLRLTGINPKTETPKLVSDMWKVMDHHDLPFAKLVRKLMEKYDLESTWKDLDAGLLGMSEWEGVVKEKVALHLRKAWAQEMGFRLEDVAQ